MLLPFLGNGSHQVYNDWNPPSSAHVYRMMCNIPYEQLKYATGKGFATNKVNEIKRKIRNKTYCCKTCSYYMEYGNLCNLKNLNVIANNSICKSFEPK
jgi:hypothetical protein